jgi:hypothetical protein
MGDTFELDSTHRLTYRTLAGALLTKHQNVFQDLINACYYLHRLPNTADTFKLLEAHIFGPVTFAHDVTRMHIAESELNEAVKKNAKAFGKKFNIKGFFVKENYRWGEEVDEL